MRERPWFRRYPERHLADPEVLSWPWACRGLYGELRDLCWARGGLEWGTMWPRSIPAEVAIRTPRGDGPGKLWARYGHVVGTKFELKEDGRFWDKDLWEEYLNATSEENSWRRRKAKTPETSAGDQNRSDEKRSDRIRSDVEPGGNRGNAERPMTPTDPLFENRSGERRTARPPPDPIYADRPGETEDARTERLRAAVLAKMHAAKGAKNGS